MVLNSSILDVFKRCVAAIGNGKLIHRDSQKDKEFHFQNWFRERLEETGLHHEMGGRNSYPDFRMVAYTEGYEIKGLAYPGRELNYDSNSQVPSGNHNGRTIYYVFGRYPSRPDGDTYPVLDLVICHGDFLNSDHDYVHKNKSIKGFGSYGDITIRDRKMYVAPTPFGLLSGVAHSQTLILPREAEVPIEFTQVGELVRKETDHLVTGYTFDLNENILSSTTIPNPNAGREHFFQAWQIQSNPNTSVTMRYYAPQGTKKIYKV